LAGGLITAIAFAAAPIAGADKVADLHGCVVAGGSYKDCCEKAGGDYYKGPHSEQCAILESSTVVIKDPDGQLRDVEIDGSNSPPPPTPPTNATAILPPGWNQTQ
jgi:hypothetical protein